jgi:ribosomal protein L7Ae-like RNA K-turn-binding protein
MLSYELPHSIRYKPVNQLTAGEIKLVIYCEDVEITTIHYLLNSLKLEYVTRKLYIKRKHLY